MLFNHFRFLKIQGCVSGRKPQPTNWTFLWQQPPALSNCKRQQFSTMEMSKTSKYLILKTPLKHILSLFSKPILPFGTCSSSGSCFSFPRCSLTRRLLRRVKDQQPARTCSLGTKQGLNVGEGRKTTRRTGHGRGFSQLRPEFHQRSGQKPSWRRVDVPPVAVPGQALTKFNKRPPKAIPRTAADKERFGLQSGSVFLPLQQL